MLTEIRWAGKQSLITRIEILSIPGPLPLAIDMMTFCICLHSTAFIVKRTDNNKSFSFPSFPVRFFLFSQPHFHTKRPPRRREAWDQLACGSAYMTSLLNYQLWRTEARTCLNFTVKSRVVHALISNPGWDRETKRKVIRWVFTLQSVFKNRPLNNSVLCSCCIIFFSLISVTSLMWCA